MMFYTLVYFKGILEEKYFQHLAVYITGIRLLCQERCSKTDLIDAMTLINFFYKQFSHLYGIENLTYKIHAHSHLVAQVCLFGPLHKISSFPLESINIFYSIR